MFSTCTLKRRHAVVHALSLCICVFGLFDSAPLRAELRVVTEIPPIHALVAAVMKGAGTPKLLLSRRVLPHAVSLSPSQARMLAKAQLVVLIGDSFTPFEAKIRSTPRRLVLKLTEQKLPHLILLGEGEAHEEEAHAHGHGRYDTHVWLDPLNALAIVELVARELSRLDPGHARLYGENVVVIRERIRALHREIRDRMGGQGGGKFLVLHDAYSYFTRRYAIKGQEVLRGARRSLALQGARSLLRARVRSEGAGYDCVIVLPQAPRSLREGIAPVGTPRIMIDPLGWDIGAGDDFYFEFLESIASGFERCRAR